MTTRRWIQDAMGTTVTVGGSIDDVQAHQIFASIDEDEARFSRFLPNSELSRFARGEIDFDRISPDLRQLLTRCDDLRAHTNGDFDHRPGPGPSATGSADALRADHPVLDPNGFAKGWIVDRAAIAGIAAGARSFTINAGGDLAIVGDRSDKQRVGIVDPSRPDRIAAVVAVASGAVATSGRYERGEHLRGDAHTLQSATVVGPTLALADALATAALVCGEPCPPWWDRFPDYSLLTIDDDEQLWMTDGMAVHLCQPAVCQLETH